MVLGNKLKAGETVFLLCDFQECFRQAAEDFSRTAEVARRLVTGAKLLEIPLIVTEQVIIPKWTSRRICLILTLSVSEGTRENCN